MYRRNATIPSLVQMLQDEHCDCKKANIGAFAGIWAHIAAIFLVGSSISFISCFELKLIGPL